MTTAEQASRIEAISANQILSQEEKDFFIKGALIMFGLGWPVGPTDVATCERAIAGLLPRYESGATLLDERATQAKEALAKRLSLKKSKP
jgi:hypothetical protein